MSYNAKNPHAAHVDAWIEQTTVGLSAEKLGSLYGHALQALWRRSSVTLSDVTLLVIFDRALVICQEKHPPLSSLKLDADGVSLNGLNHDARQFTPTQLNQAFRCLIIELMTIIGNLTAEILTGPLYGELTLITANHTSPESAPKIERKHG